MQNDRIQVDTIKATFTYAAAVLVLVGGLFAIIFVTMPADKLAIVSGLVGGSAAFLYGQEASTRTARQVIAGQQTNGTQRETLKNA